MTDDTTVEFDLGDIYITSRAHRALAEAGLDAEAFLECHARGDWGETSDMRRKVNGWCLGQDRGSIQSVFQATPDFEIWIRTHIDHRLTFIFAGNDDLVMVWP